MLALIRHYTVKDGQRFWWEQPLSRELLEDWPTAGEYVLDEMRHALVSIGISPPEEPVILCWLRPIGGTEREAVVRPRVWTAWPAELTERGPAAISSERHPPWADSADATLLLLDRVLAVAAAVAWPSERWHYYWDPTAAYRDAAGRRGISAKLVGGPFPGRVVRVDGSPTLRLPSLNGLQPGFEELIYTRDPEPSGLAADGSVLWTFRHQEPGAGSP